jgi:hypothetical protein
LHTYYIQRIASPAGLAGIGAIAHRTVVRLPVPPIANDHFVRYHGIIGPAAKDRAKVCPNL